MGLNRVILRTSESPVNRSTWLLPGFCMKWLAGQAFRLHRLVLVFWDGLKYRVTRGLSLFLTPSSISSVMFILSASSET